MKNTHANKTPIPRTLSSAIKKGFAQKSKSFRLTNAQVDSLIPLDATGTRHGHLIGITTDRDDNSKWLAQYRYDDGSVVYVTIPKGSPIPQEN